MPLRADTKVQRLLIKIKGVSVYKILIRYCSYFLVLFAFVLTTPSHAQLKEEITLVITHGQSLSIGVSSNTYAGVSTIPEFPSNALTLNSNYTKYNSIGWQLTLFNPNVVKGFMPLSQNFAFNESPGSGIVNSILNLYQVNGLSVPKIVHINTGHGGRSVAELMVRRNLDLYSSAAVGAASVQEGFPFYTKDSSGNYYFYTRQNGVAVAQPPSKTNVEPVYFENMQEEVKKIIQIANANNQTINPNVYMVWIQGQSDGTTKNYKFLMNELFNRAENDLRASTALGSNLNLHVFVSQLRGTANKDRAVDQYEITKSRPNTYAAAQESWISNGFAMAGGQGTHLSKLGYRVMGEQIGNSIFQQMQTGQVSFPMMKNVSIVGNKVTVQFEGLRGSLVDDPSVHVAANFAIPPHFGFGLYTTAGKVISTPSIIASQIIGPDQVELTFSGPFTVATYLYLGRNQTRIDPAVSASLHSGTTLRDSVQDDFYGYALAAPTFIGNKIPRFAPIQRWRVK